MATPEVVILIGLQGAGKSSFYRERFAATHALVSKDAMPNVRDRKRRQLAMLAESLERGQSVVIDNTNPGPADRQPLIEVALAFNALVVGFYFESRLAICLERNAGRAGKACVPDVALYVTSAQLKLPNFDEGFDQLFYVRIGDDGFVVAPWDENL